MKFSSATGARDVLCSLGVRVTRPREDVLQLLITQRRPMSHGEISSSMPYSADKVTLYRTLDFLVRVGAAHQVQGPDGTLRYCANGADTGNCPGGHPHFMCTSCGTMTCIEGQGLPYVEMPPQVTVLGKQYVIYGHCAACTKNMESTKKSEGNDSE